MNMKYLPMCLILAVSGTSALSAFAAEPVTVGIEEVVVTARMREESLQDVPESITAYGREQIEAYGIDEYFDFVRITPGLSMVESSQSPGIALFNLRGIGQQLNQEPPVAVIVDGVQIASSAAITQSLVDVERIEVVKGPQGALYGRNAIGGAINIVTKQPTDELSGYALAGIGTNGYRTTEAVIRGPVIQQKMKFSLAGGRSDYDGDFKNTATGKDVNPLENWFFRGRLMTSITDNLDIDLRYNHSETENAGYNAVILPGGDAGDFSVTPQSGRKGGGEREIDEAAVLLTLETSLGTLTSTTSYVDSSDASGYDLDQRPFDLIDLALQITEIEAFSEELRISSASDKRFRYTAGVYYLETEQSRGTDVVLYPLVTGAPVPITLSTDTRQDNTAWAVFAQASYDLRPDLELTLGLRYDEDEREQTDLFSGIINEETFDSLQPKLSLAYDLTDDILIYGTYGEGFRSGGFNQPSPTFPLIYDAEETESYELGIKSQWLDSRIQFNSALFYTLQDNQQVTLVDVQNAGAQGIVTIDETSFTGIEFELLAYLNDDLKLTSGLSFVDTEVETFDSAPQYEGNQSPYSPEVTWSIGLDYAMTLQNDWQLDFHIDYSGQSGLYYEYFGTIEQPSYGLTNIRIGLRHGNVTLELFGENVFDEEYYTDVASNFITGGLGDLAIRGRRDRFGVQLKLEL